MKISLITKSFRNEVKLGYAILPAFEVIVFSLKRPLSGKSNLRLSLKITVSHIKRLLFNFTSYDVRSAYTLDGSSSARVQYTLPSFPTHDVFNGLQIPLVW